MLNSKDFLGESNIKISEDNLKILILVPHYKFFIKELVEATSPYIESITVLVRHNHLTELSRYFSNIKFLHNVRRYTKNNLLDLKGKPENVNVHLNSMIYFVTEGKNKSLGNKIAKNAEKLINEKGIKFDLIHAHFTHPYGYAAVKLGQKYNVPVVITIHRNRDSFLKEYNSGNERLYWTWKNADALIRVNQKDVQVLKEFNKNVFHIPNGFNPRTFFAMDRSKALEILNLPKDRKIIFTFSNLIERKGFQYLIDSMNEIVKVRKDVLCFIGGSGLMKRKLEAKIQNLELQEYIKLIGYVPDDSINYWLNAADLFVLPSLSEGNPTVMFEALGTGLPFVGTRVGGVPEIITSEDYGLLCEPANPKDLAEKILIGLNKEWDREKILKYAQQFTWEKIAKETMGIYNELLI